MQYLVAVLCLAACACAADHFSDCGSKGGTIKSVRVNGEEKCELKMGKDATYEFEFESTSSTADTVEVNCVARFVGIGKKFPLNDRDGCRTGGITCPLKEGKSYTYKNTVGTPLARTKTEFLVYWAFRDSDKNTIWCIKLTCQGV